MGLTQTETRILLALLESSMSGEALLHEFGSGAPQHADSLADAGLIYRSARGNYAVTSAVHDKVIAALGSDAPTVPSVPVAQSRVPRGCVELFNGVCDAPTYSLMLRDGLHGARETDRAAVERIQPGDLLLGYVTEPYSEWVAVQRVTDWPFETEPRLHGHVDLPFRVPAEFIVALPVGKGFGRLEASDAAHASGGKAAPHRHSPKRVDPIGGRVIVRRLLELARHEPQATLVAPLGSEYERLFGVGGEPAKQHVQLTAER